MADTQRFHRRFEELTDVCDAMQLDVQLHATLHSGEPGHADAEYDFTVFVTDGADGKTAITARGVENIDVAAYTALNQLRQRGLGA